MNEAPKLYEINSSEHRDKSNPEKMYGYKLAVNSESKWVMELKGTGKVITVDPWCVTEVIPYTIDVSFDDRRNHNYSYIARNGAYNVGDVLVISANNAWCMVRVEKIDTNSKAAYKEIKPIAIIKGTNK